MYLYGGAADADRYLYHYTTAKVAIERILGQRTLRMGPLEKTNDPREALPWTVHFSAEEGFTDAEVTRAFDEVPALIRRNVFLTCLVQDDIRPDLPAGQLGRGWARSRMWHQYAADHTGICIIFDREALISEALQVAPNAWHAPVIYTDDYPHYPATSLSLDEIRAAGFEDVVERHVREHVAPLFFTKNRDWQAEYEYRILSRHGDGSAPLIDVSTCVVGAVVGPKASVADVNECVELMRDLPSAHEPAQVHWSNGVPQCLPTVTST